MDRRFLTTIVLAIALLVVCALYLRRACDEHLIEYGEGPMLSLAKRLTHEPAKPEWIARPPYTCANYGPGYFWLLALGAELNPGYPSVIPGRLMAFAAALATAAAIGWVIARRMGDIDQGLLAALAYLASPVVTYWVPAARCDTLAVAFSCFALLVVGRSRTSLVASALLIGLGSLAKQTVAVSAAPIFLFLLFSKRYRDAVFYAVCVCLSGAAVWGAVSWWTEGYFGRICNGANVNRMYLTSFLAHVRWFLITPFAGICLYLIARRMQRTGLLKSLRTLPALAFVVSLGLSAVLSAKEGASMNYFIECCALGSILIGLAPLPSASLPRFGVLAGFAAVVLIPCVFNLTIGLGAFNRVNTASEATLIATLTETPPDLPIVADGKWIAGVVGAERTPIVNDPYSFRQMSDNGMIDQSPVVAALERGMVGAVIFDRPIDAQFKNPMLHWPIPVLEVIAQKYALVHQGESIYVYLPKTEIARRARRSESGLRAKTY